MKPFPSLNTMVRDLRYRALHERRVEEEGGMLVPIRSYSGRIYFFELLRDRWIHRHEEPFDYRGAIEHLKTFSDDLPFFREHSQGVTEKPCRDVQRDIEELLKGLSKEQAHAERNRDRDRNSRPVRHEANMTTIMELLLEQWRGL